MASISSEGSNESHLVEQEDIICLTHDVRGFKEALGKLRRTFQTDREKLEAPLRVCAHEKLGEVLRIMRVMLEKYPALQSNELVSSAGGLIQQVKSYDYEEDSTEPKDLFEALDGLAFSFSTRVSEYLMGDIDSNRSVSSSTSSKTKSCENLLGSSDVDNFSVEGRENKEGDGLSFEEMDRLLMSLDQGVDHALHRAKVWSKYAKDIMSYVEKRSNLELEFARQVTKLAQTTRPLLKEEKYLPFQSIYCAALDQDEDLCASIHSTSTLLQGYKFVEPLSARRNEHERNRKLMKERWHKELKKMHESVYNLRKAKSYYIQKQSEWEKAREAFRVAEAGVETGGVEPGKVEKRRRSEEDAMQKAAEAETNYKACVNESNERHRNLLTTKAEILLQARELILQCDQTMKATTVAYFQLQNSLAAQTPIQYQTFCESSRLYEPGSQYMEFVKNLPQSKCSRFSTKDPFAFEHYNEEGVDKSRKSTASLESVDEGRPNGRTWEKLGEPVQAWSPAVPPSDTESVESRESCKSRETSPSASPTVAVRPLQVASGASSEELENEADAEQAQHSRHQVMSKAAITHKFKKLKTPSRCRECDSYVYWGVDCGECGLASHKKCLETLALQCGHKRLPRKMTTFGIDLGQHLLETGAQIPPLVCKCVSEIDHRGVRVKGIYRLSAVKSKVEKLCQAFENGAELVDLTDIHLNVIVDVLKLYMRQLPEPLLMFKYYSDFIKISKDYPQGCEREELACKDLKELTKKLPKHHFLTLGFLMHHLRRVSIEKDVNQMPASNLGIIFGPALLRTGEGSASLSSLVDTMLQSRVVELLVRYATEVFGPSEGVLPRDYQRYTTRQQIPRSISSERNVRVVGFLPKTNRRPPCDEVEGLPGQVDSNPPSAVGDSADDYLLETAPLSDEEDAPVLPDFLLPDYSGRQKRSPLLHRGNAPIIITSSLRNFSGLEGVSATMLSTQDSLESSHSKKHQGGSRGSAGGSLENSSRPAGKPPLLKQNSTERRVFDPDRTPVDEGPKPVESRVVANDVDSRNPSSKCPRTVQTAAVASDIDVEYGDEDSSSVDTTSDSSVLGRVITSTYQQDSVSPRLFSSGSEQRRRQGPHISQANIINLEENRVKIVVPGGQQSGRSNSLDVEENHLGEEDQIEQENKQLGHQKPYLPTSNSSQQTSHKMDKSIKS